MLLTCFDTSKIYFKKLPCSSLPLINNNKVPHVIWGHGWGLDHNSLLPLASSLQNFAHHWLIDFPGFGKSPHPPEFIEHNLQPWSSKEYADLLVAWIKNNLPNNAPKIWVGHSFGCRVGINLAAHNKNLLKGMFLIAAAGIPKPRNLFQKLKKVAKVAFFKVLKNILILFNKHNYLNHLKTKIGSPDYKNAQPHMRAILVKVVNEDLRNIATKINCPTELAYGSKDTETPVIIGQMLQKNIKNSILHIVPGKNHNNILQNDIHQIVYLIKKFIMEVKNL